jgi:hypothetical protein
MNRRCEPARGVVAWKLWMGLGVVLVALGVNARAVGERDATVAGSKEPAVSSRAKGTFDVKVTPREPGDLQPFARLDIEKTWHGDLEGTSRGVMLASSAAPGDSGGYVALEQVTATLAGRQGSFQFQHSGTMDKGAADLSIVVAPGSGTGGLSGIAGRLTLTIAGGRHDYEFEYTLPGR